METRERVCVFSSLFLLPILNVRERELSLQQKKTIALMSRAGNTNRKGRLTTVDLLVPTCVVKLL